MIRRLHVTDLRAGDLDLDPDQAHHLRDVLRLAAGDMVELFDDSGASARATIARCDRTAVVVTVGKISATAPASGIVVAAALPKGDRADWMIEKLSELGVDRFIPLKTGRSIVAPAGKNKHERWQRLAIESAKQSRRGGVMRIEQIMPLEACLDTIETSYAIALATEGTASPLPLLQSQIANRKSQILLLIGPEGGWTADELDVFARRNLTRARLTPTILRVETAAVAAAAIVATWRAAHDHGASQPAGPT